MFDRAYPRLPRHLRRKPTYALFIFVPRGKFESDLVVPILIRNDTRRIIGDIVVELTYPAEFFLANPELKRRRDRLVESFGEEYEAHEEEVRRFLETRRPSDLGSAVRIRYELGKLRAGEGQGFFEPFVLPPRESAFAAGLFQDTAFANVLAHMRDGDRLRAAFHLQVAIFSDLAPRQQHAIDVVLVKDGHAEPQSEDLKFSAEENAAFGEYVNAYWFNSLPAGRTFRRIRLGALFFGRPLRREVPVDTILVERDFDVSEPKDGNVLVATRADPLKSRYGIASLFLPGYDPRKLDRDVTAAEEALQRIGWFEKGVPLTGLSGK